MTLYRSTKEVYGYEMNSTQWMEFRKNLQNYSDANIDEGLEGYVVRYNAETDNEYWSWSPKDVFESGHYELLKVKDF